jgi:hypothetical protein
VLQAAFCCRQLHCLEVSSWCDCSGSPRAAWFVVLPLQVACAYAGHPWPYGMGGVPWVVCLHQQWAHARANCSAVLMAQACVIDGTQAHASRGFKYTNVGIFETPCMRGGRLCVCTCADPSAYHMVPSANASPAGVGVGPVVVYLPTMVKGAGHCPFWCPAGRVLSRSLAVYASCDLGSVHDAGLGLAPPARGMFFGMSIVKHAARLVHHNARCMSCVPLCKQARRLVRCRPRDAVRGPYVTVGSPPVEDSNGLQLGSQRA